MQSAQPRHEDHSKTHSEEWHDAAEEDAVSEPDEFHDAEDDHQASATAPSSAQAPSEQGSASSAKLDQAVHATQSSHAAQPSRTEPLNPQTIAQAGKAAVAAEDQPESDAPEPSSVAPSDSDAGQAAAASEAEVQEPEGVDQAASAPPELTEQQKEELEEMAELCKLDGNTQFKQRNWEASANKYAEGLDHALPGSQQRATLYANRAACFMEMRHWQNAARDCTEAINIDGGYLKAWHRRCKAYEALGDHERALKDALKIFRFALPGAGQPTISQTAGYKIREIQELSPSDPVARATVSRLTPIVEQEREKMKEEMLGKLKDLGNSVLGKFGMSLDNFKATKDPSTGAYSINFGQ